MVITMAKKFEVEVTVPEGLVAGDVFVLEVEAPTSPRKPRGMLAGLTVEEMTDDQLKREIINANSVLYKAKQRGANPEIIAANEVRLAAAKAEKEKRTPVKPVVEEGPMAEVLAEAPAEDVYNEDITAEI